MTGLRPGDFLMTIRIAERTLAAVTLFSAITIAFVFTSMAQRNESVLADRDDVLQAEPVKPAEDPRNPRRHFRVGDPANLSDVEAEGLYATLKEDMARRHKLSRIAQIADYQKWKRFNRVPYRSNSHGRRYINNYANDIASDYGRFELAGRLPVGSVIAKDSFSVRQTGAASIGPLFVMEKMPSGFNYASGNWRYTMVMPDGSIFGTTRGDGSQRVRFCISCHLAVEHQDHLFLIPKAYRLN